MRKKTLLISSADRDRLQPLIDSALLDARVSLDNLKALEGELARATIVAPDELPADVIAMNSTVWFRDLDDGEVESYTLVYPSEADVFENRISIFAPIGTALLGYRAHDLIDWQVPAGKRRIEIVKVVQAAEPAAVLA